jgi:prepilin-type N-terminal cleavage/methylation domain-containing protein
VKEKHQQNGFTLAELLITLGILGIIATFTIPKILDSSTDTKYNAIAKEAASMITGAYQTYKLNNGANSSMKTTDLTPYMNYIATDTTTLIDQENDAANTSISCGLASSHCLKLHNGAFLRIFNNLAFGGSASTNAIYFLLDPNGKFDGHPPGRSVMIWLYYDGKLRTYATLEANTMTSTGGPYGPIPTDPAWLSWN